LRYTPKRVRRYHSLRDKAHSGSNQAGHAPTKEDSVVR
jgi:hypothetical protein